jgi:hypothetical protein
MIGRRFFLGSLGLALAPAIIRPGLCMPISSRVAPRVWRVGWGSGLELVWPVFDGFGYARDGLRSLLHTPELRMREGDIVEYHHALFGVGGGRWSLDRYKGVSLFGTCRSFEISFLETRGHAPAA